MSSIGEQRNTDSAANDARLKIRTYIINNYLLGAAENFDDATLLMESGALDSTAVMELVAFLEESFAIAVGEDEIVPENLNSVDSICAFVARKSA